MTMNPVVNQHTFMHLSTCKYICPSMYVRMIDPGLDESETFFFQVKNLGKTYLSHICNARPGTCKC